MKILFSGNLNDYSESYSRFRALERLKNEVIPVATLPIIHYPGITKGKSVFERYMDKLGVPQDRFGINKRIEELLNYFKFDVFWNDKSLELKKKTLHKIQDKNPNCILVFSSGDNMTVKDFRGGFWEETIESYDLHLTAKSNAVKGLYKMGCKKVLYVPKAYDHVWMFPEHGHEKVYDVTFIGSYERQRCEWLQYLATSGIEVNVWGNGWGKVKGGKSLTIHQKPLYKYDYRRMIAKSKINLCFLRRLAEDLHTNRTFDIPAMGGFMLAERTREQMDFFMEGSEADFFSSKAELVRKVKHYLSVPDQIDLIAKQGRVRCEQSKYTYEDRLFDVTNFIQELVACEA